MIIRLVIILSVLCTAACAARSSAPAEEHHRAAVFSLRAPDAASVGLAGTFNRWDPSAHRLSGPDRDGVWTITVPLHPGRYEYLFLVNGAAWTADPDAPDADDGMGGRNSVLIIAPQ